METSQEIDVISLDAEHRRALEDVIGRQLQRNQRLLISVTEVELPPAQGTPRRGQSIRDWTAVYEGLTDREVEDIDRVVNTRVDLTRHLP